MTLLTLTLGIVYRSTETDQQLALAQQQELVPADARPVGTSAEYALLPGLAQHGVVGESFPDDAVKVVHSGTFRRVRSRFVLPSILSAFCAWPCCSAFAIRADVGTYIYEC